MNIILIFGLPGTGKTTLCRLIESSYKDSIYYADIGTHNDFRKKPMRQICGELYREYGDGRTLISEGMLPKRVQRDRYVQGIINDLNKHGISVENVLIVGMLPERLETLSLRRNRSTEEYKELLLEFEFGSDFYTYIKWSLSPDAMINKDAMKNEFISILKSELPQKFPLSSIIG